MLGSARTYARTYERVQCRGPRDGRARRRGPRASQGDPTSRFYTLAAFDVVAACMYGPTGAWTFRYMASTDLVPHGKHEGRIAPLQPIDDGWAHSLVDAIGSA